MAPSCNEENVLSRNNTVNMVNGSEQFLDGIYATYSQSGATWITTL